MTSWNIVPDADIDAESPITESLMFRLRDNPKSVNENDVSVPYAQLQLAEGIRTSLAEGHGIVADNAGRMIDGGVLVGNTLTSDDTTTTNDVTIDLPTTGTFMAWAQGQAGNPAVQTRVGFCHIIDNVIINQSYTEADDNSPNNSSGNNAFNISAGKLQFAVGGNIATTPRIYLIRVS